MPPITCYAQIDDLWGAAGMWNTEPGGGGDTVTPTSIDTCEDNGHAVVVDGNKTVAKITNASGGGLAFDPLVATPVTMTCDMECTTSIFVVNDVGMTLNVIGDIYPAVGAVVDGLAGFGDGTHSLTGTIVPGSGLDGSQGVGIYAVLGTALTISGSIGGASGAFYRGPALMVSGATAVVTAVALDTPAGCEAFVYVVSTASMDLSGVNWTNAGKVMFVVYPTASSVVDAASRITETSAAAQTCVMGSALPVVKFQAPRPPVAPICRF